MSVRLALLSLYLRLVEKPKLARARDPLVIRRGFERMATRWFPQPGDANILEDRMDGPAGPIAVDWISQGRPDRRAVVVYYHGGAYVMGSRATHRHVGAHIAAASGARVVMPEYRLAPEHPYPAAVDDAFAVYKGLLDAGYDPKRIALAGDSAGGGLAFVTLLKARAAGLPDPACLVGLSPWLDLTMTQNSLRRNARKDPLLPVSRFGDVIGFYLAGADPYSPFASPLLGAVPRPPPALIQASRIEILADEAEAMADKWREAGGDVRLEWWRAAPHAWHIFVGLAPEAKEAIDRVGGFIRMKIEAEAETEAVAAAEGEAAASAAG